MYAAIHRKSRKAFIVVALSGLVCSAFVLGIRYYSGCNLDDADDQRLCEVWRTGSAECKNKAILRLLRITSFEGFGTFNLSTSYFANKDRNGVLRDLGVPDRNLTDSVWYFVGRTTTDKLSHIAVQQRTFLVVVFDDEDNVREIDLVN